MSITDELREYALGWDERNRVRRDLRAIADRIDTEHEHGMEERADRYSELRAKMNNCYIELPKDADSEYIHVGDEMCGYGWPNGGVYCRAIVNEVTILVGPQDGAYRGWLMWAANECRHHHAPTVEDVLTEMVAKVIERGELTNGAAQTIAEYAGKLRLVEEDA